MPRDAERKRRDWADGHGAHLELAIVLAGVALVAMGVLMSLQDYGRELQNQQALATFGSTLGPDPAARLKYVPVLTWLSVFVSVAAAWRAYRVKRSPRLARHARRPVAILLLGCGILDAAFYADHAFGLTTRDAVRAVLIDPAYAVAGVLVAGAAWRIRTLIRPLPVLDPDH